MPRRRSLPIEITGGDVDVPSRATTWTEMPVEWKPGSPATAPEQLTEERLKEEEYDQGLRTTFSCVFEGFSRELSSHYIINTNCNALYSPIHYRKVANM